MKSAPLLLLNAPGTFSQTANRGRICLPVLPMRSSAALISLIILTASKNRLLRWPSCMPSCFPATLKSWHGLPKVMMSTGFTAPPLMSVTLPSCLASGNLAEDTLIQNGSISESHFVSIPFIKPASGKPEIPSNKLPSVIEQPPFVSCHIAYGTPCTLARNR